MNRRIKIRPNEHTKRKCNVASNGDANSKTSLKESVSHLIRHPVWIQVPSLPWKRGGEAFKQAGEKAATAGHGIEMMAMGEMGHGTEAATPAWYDCDGCGTSYPNFEQAADCEKRHDHHGGADGMGEAVRGVLQLDFIQEEACVICREYPFVAESTRKEKRVHYEACMARAPEQIRQAWPLSCGFCGVRLPDMAVKVLHIDECQMNPAAFERYRQEQKERRLALRVKRKEARVVEEEKEDERLWETLENQRVRWREAKENARAMAMAKKDKAATLQRGEL